MSQALMKAAQSGNKASHTGAIMREDAAYLQRMIPAPVKFEFRENIAQGESGRPEEYNNRLEFG
jgi:hypothetical protein